MSLIEKVRNSLKRDGIFCTIKKIFRAIKYRTILFFRRKNNLLKKYVDIHSFDTIIVFENNFGWNKIMKQRPQQIAENIPATTLMIYHSHEDADYPEGKRLRKLKENLVLADLGYFRDRILEELSFHSNKYLMIYSTDYIPLNRINMYIKYRYKVIYDYVDDVNQELSGAEMYKILFKRHKKLLTNENVCTICTAEVLQRKARKITGKRPLIISNGVDYEHFKYQPYEIPSDMVDIRKKYEYLICYYGALASWFDYELVGKLAENRNYAIVLIGQDYDGTIEKSGILNHENIYFLGRKSYEELPRYGCNVDVCIIPFLINDITMATNPVKVFEYMAMERPVVTTALPECHRYKSVLFSADHDEFIANVHKATTLVDDEYRALERAEALENTWRSKAETMVHYANDAKYRELRENLLALLQNETYDRIVIWRSPFGWNVPLYQRPQHIATQLSKQRCLVFYEVTLDTDLVETLHKQSKNLYLVNFKNTHMSDLLFSLVDQCSIPKYIQIYSTNWDMSVEEIQHFESRGYSLLYEYIDDINPDLAGTDEIPPYIADKYEYVLQNPAVPIVTTAKALYEDVRSKRGTEKLVLSTNGVDYPFFQDFSAKYKCETEFLSLVQNGKINVCYYGALATWFDYELIREIDRTNKYNIILFGIKYDSAYDQSGIDKLENVHFLGPREYKVLKYYARYMDILMIPFVINAITQATSPLKLFEYMALHKPIVTTAMNECKNYASVLTAENHTDFLQKLEECTHLKDSPEYMQLLDQEARENDWSIKAKIILDMLSKFEAETMSIA